MPLFTTYFKFMAKSEHNAVQKDYVNMGDFLKWKRNFEEEKVQNLNSLMTPAFQSAVSTSSNRLTIIGQVQGSSAVSHYQPEIDVTAGGTADGEEKVA